MLLKWHLLNKREFFYWVCIFSIPTVLFSSEKSWRMQIEAKSGSLSDIYNFIGVDESATDGYDGPPLDIFNLSPFSDTYIDIYIPHNDWGSYNGNFSSDIREFNGNLKEWTVNLCGKNVSENIVLNLKFNQKVENWDIAFSLDNSHFTTITDSHSIILSPSQLPLEFKISASSIHMSIIKVPDDFKKIQEAIDYAITGDTVLVRPGLYYENIDFKGKEILISSLFLASKNTNYITQTIIDGRGNGSVVKYTNGESINSQLIGFTIRNGNSTSGGGIYCSNESNPTMSYILLIKNAADYGGAIYCDDNSGPIFSNSTIFNNIANLEGGGIYIKNAKPTFTNSIITNNTNYGIYAESELPIITFCDFWDNESGNFFNCGDIIGNNQIVNVNDDSCDLYFNIQMSPMFVDFSIGDYNLQEGSHCIDAGNPNCVPDLDGTNTDIGAFYYDQKPHSVPKITSTPSVVAIEDELYIYQVQCSGSPYPSFELLISPPEMEINSPTGLITWFPDDDDIGDNIISIKVKNYLGYDTQNFLLYVENTNDAPFLSPLPIVTIEEDDFIVIPFADWYDYVEDADNQDNALLWSIQRTANIIANNYHIYAELIPIDNWNGLDSLLIRVSDGKLSDCTYLKVHVVSVNDSPEISRSFPDTIKFFSDSTVNLNLNNYVKDVDDPKSSLIWTVEGQNYVDIMIDNNIKTAKLSVPKSWHGTEIVRFIVTDSSAASDTSTMLIMIYPEVNIVKSIGIPNTYLLSQNFPNPFNSATIISYQLPKSSNVSMSVYNISGRLIETLVNEKQQPGYYLVQWDASQYSSGVYIYRIQADRFFAVKKCILMK